MELVTARTGPRSRNLVFTSAGDHSNVHRWLAGHRDFDLWVVYYGHRSGTLQDLADRYLRRTGSKFQNLHHCYTQWPELLARYEAVLVLDDDILIDATSITRLFEIRRELDLWALQPAFRLSGKVSWPITRVHPTARLRYTNFIEMACPLFRRDKLDGFMAVYDPSIAGYGEDWWFLHSLGPYLEGRVAIVDEVPCVNPHDRTKGGVREIDRLVSHEQRKAVWEQMKARYGLDEQGRLQYEFERINKPLAGAVAAWIGHSPAWIRFNAGQWVRALFRRKPLI